MVLLLMRTSKRDELVHNVKKVTETILTQDVNSKDLEVKSCCNRKEVPARIRMLLGPMMTTETEKAQKSRWDIN